MDKKQIIGFKGESFVIMKLKESGWNELDYNGIKNYDDLIGIDKIISKNNINLKIQIKSSERLGKRTNIHYSYNGLGKDGYLIKKWDFLIFTDFINIWIYPYEFMKRKSDQGYNVTKSDDIFKNNYELLNMNDDEIMIFLVDHHLNNK